MTLTQQMVDQVFSFSELGFQEIETSRYLTDLLEKNGFQIERGIAGIPTAWIATYGSAKPVIAFITDIDCIPRASQKPGVAYHDPIVEGAPGHGVGHNSGMAVNIVAALTLKKMMDQHHFAGTFKIFPGVAEVLLGTKAFYVRAGLFKDVDIVLGSHVWDKFYTSYAMGNGEWSGLVSVQYFFHGKAAHAAGRPWEGRSALDAVELMDTGWDYRREHLRPAQRSHRVIINGGDQPNVVPSEAAVWYYFRELDFASHQGKLRSWQHDGRVGRENDGHDGRSAPGGLCMADLFPTRSSRKISKKNIEAVGMPTWSDDDQKLAKALQKDIGAKEDGLRSKVEPLDEPAKNPTGGGSDDVGDISWNVPMVYLMYPANIPNSAWSRVAQRGRDGHADRTQAAQLPVRKCRR